MNYGKKYFHEAKLEIITGNIARFPRSLIILILIKSIDSLKPHKKLYLKKEDDILRQSLHKESVRPIKQFSRYFIFSYASRIDSADFDY